MALSIHDMLATQPDPDQTVSERLLLRKGELPRLAPDEDAAREPAEIFEAIFPETREDEGVTGSD